jgi:hypothetical protein
MPGAWEQLQGKFEVLVCILTREIVSTKWALSLRNLMLPPNSGIVFLSGMPFGHARNVGAQQAVENNCTWLFFIDDDVAVPPDAYAKLKAHDKAIVSGLYFRRSPPINPVWLNKVNNEYVFQHSIDGKLHTADLVGAGCLLIKVDVFRQITRPWFEWRVDRDDLDKNDRLSEDFFFCQKAKQFGIEIHIDTSVQCDHVCLAMTNTAGVCPALL